MNKTLDSILAFLASIISGIFIAIVATKIYENNKTWIELIVLLKWWNFLFLLWLFIMIVIFVRNRNGKNVFTIRSEVLKVEQTNALIQLTIESILHPQRTGHINVHLYFKDAIKKKIILRKDRRFKFEQESFPNNHSLDYAVIDEDNLVICDSFKNDTVIYKVLPYDHVTKYTDRLKNKVDSKMKWILSCPLHNPKGESFGVVCCFGSLIPFASEYEKNNFICLIEAMSDSIVRLLLFEKGREFKFLN